MTSQSNSIASAPSEPSSNVSTPRPMSVCFSLAKGYINVSDIPPGEVETVLLAVLKVLFTGAVGAASIYEEE